MRDVHEGAILEQSIYVRCLVFYSHPPLPPSPNRPSPPPHVPDEGKLVYTVRALFELVCLSVSVSTPFHPPSAQHQPSTPGPTLLMMLQFSGGALEKLVERPKSWYRPSVGVPTLSKYSTCGDGDVGT